MCLQESPAASLSSEKIEKLWYQSDILELVWGIDRKRFII